ncbi:MAG: hypothetical protein WC551_10600 [Patescibacteria group bacterium]
MKKILMALVFVVLLSGQSMAADVGVDMDFTWTPMPGDKLLSSDIRQDHAEIEAWMNASSDSTITWDMIGAAAVNSTHLAPGAITAQNGGLDSGAIWSDTQFAGTFTYNTARFVSTSDTNQNWVRSLRGSYTGTGTDTRFIQNTEYDSDGDPSGETISLTAITSITVYPSNGLSGLETWDSMDDTAAFNSGAGTLLDIRTTGLFGGYDGVGNVIRCINNAVANPYFTVNATDFGSNLVSNADEVVHYWKATGY